MADRVFKALQTTGFTIIPEFSMGERLRADFKVIELNVILEVQGSQHSIFNGFHYDSKASFNAAKRRDDRKEELAESMGLKLICLDEKEIMAAKSPEELAQLILTKIANTQTETEEW